MEETRSRACQGLLAGLAVLALVAILALAWDEGGVVLAQISPSYNLEWHVIGGGQPPSSTHYAVQGTAGQAAASGPLLSTSTHFAVSGGFWYSDAWMWRVYLPLVLRADRN